MKKLKRLPIQFLLACCLVMGLLQVIGLKSFAAEKTKRNDPFDLISQKIADFYFKTKLIFPVAK